MDRRHCFRRRRWPNAAEYSRLEDDSDTSQYSDSSGNSASRRKLHKHRPMLCDRCWNRRKRATATKRCLDCKQNLCFVCASSDEIRRPWWLPQIIVQCWRYLFTSVFIPHSIIPLDGDTNINSSPEQRRPQWTYSQEASHVQNIPRIKRSSLTSLNSKASSNKSERNAKHADVLGKHESEQCKSDKSHSYDSKQDKMFSRSRSTEENKHGHKSSKSRRIHSKRSRSADRTKREAHADRDMSRVHADGTLNSLRHYSANWDNEQLETSKEKAFSRKLKGKDVTIEITANEFKISVDKGTKDDSSKHKNKRQTPSKKTKLKSKSYQPYTEEIFDEVPIWFKKSDSLDSKASSKSAKEQNQPFQHKAEHTYQHQGRNTNNENINQRTNNANDNTPYIVEEPPDLCPICLEELPGRESRRLSCCHLLHTHCVIEYLQGTELDFGIPCPLCNHVTLIHNYYAPRRVWYSELPVSTTV